MRIFMLVQDPAARGPVPKHTRYLVDGLRALGCTVVTHPWGSRSAGVGLAGTIAERLRDVRSVAREVDRQPFDVGVVKTSHDWRTLLRDLAVVAAMRRSRRPLVLQLHGSRAAALVEPGHRAFKAATAVLLAMVDGVMVLSTEEQRQWRSFRSQPPVFTVKNPYVRSFGATAAADERRDAPPQLLFVARLIEQKGVFDLVDAFQSVLERTQCELVLAGDGPCEPELRRRVATAGIAGRVRFAGYLTGEELATAYRRATVFVLPSWSEGFPTVLAEAMDAGLPVVTTRIRGAADHLVEGENALFVEPREVDALASALTTLLLDPERRARMAEANRARVDVFAPDVVAREYLDVLRAVLAGAGDRRTAADDQPRLVWRKLF
jgi:glycosyltransferase involved in cell wall biosynthesis